MLIFLTICTRSIVLVYAGLLDSMLAFTRPHRNQLHQPPSDHINGEKNKSLFLLGRLASNLHKIPPPPVCRLVREPNCRTVRHLRQLRQCYHRRWLATLSSQLVESPTNIARFLVLLFQFSLGTHKENNHTLPKTNSIRHVKKITPPVFFCLTRIFYA